MKKEPQRGNFRAAALLLSSRLPRGSPFPVIPSLPRDLSRMRRKPYAVSQAAQTAYGEHMERLRPVRFAALRRLTQGDIRNIIIFCARKNHIFCKRTLVGAVGCALALPRGAKLACALRSSSSQKSHSVAIFGSPFRAPLRFMESVKEEGEFAAFL